MPAPTTAKMCNNIEICKYVAKLCWQFLIKTFSIRLNFKANNIVIMKMNLEYAFGKIKSNCNYVI